MRYWFLRMHIQNGEYEHSSLSLHKTEGEEKFDEDAYAKDFYGDGDGEDTYGNGTYYFNDGCIACYPSILQEITAREYEVLDKYL
jgi:hypothetical protein